VVGFQLTPSLEPRSEADLPDSASMLKFKAPGSVLIAYERPRKRVFSARRLPRISAANC